jgi:hypothetical protein
MASTASRAVLATSAKLAPAPGAALIYSRRGPARVACSINAVAPRAAALVR